MATQRNTIHSYSHAQANQSILLEYFPISSANKAHFFPSKIVLIISQLIRNEQPEYKYLDKPTNHAYLLYRPLFLDMKIVMAKNGAGLSKICTKSVKLQLKVWKFIWWEENKWWLLRNKSKIKSIYLINGPSKWEEMILNRSPILQKMNLHR